MLKKVVKRYKAEIQAGVLGFVVGIIFAYLFIVYVTLDPNVLFRDNDNGAFLRAIVFLVGLAFSLISTIIFEGVKDYE